MAKPDPRIDAFFHNAPRWREELLALRAILLTAPLTEAFKWRSPAYTFQGGNVATLWRLRDHCAIGFFRGVLLADPEGLLVPPGKNSRAVRLVTFTNLAEVAARQTPLTALIDAAIAVQKSGRKVDLPKDDLAYPAELAAALDTDPALATAFAALTPGRRRGYVLHFAQATQAATRAARIERHRPRILGGKGMHDR